MSVLPKTIFRFNVITIKMPMTCVTYGYFIPSTHSPWRHIFSSILHRMRRKRRKINVWKIKISPCSPTMWGYNQLPFTSHLSFWFSPVHLSSFISHCPPTHATSAVTRSVSPWLWTFVHVILPVWDHFPSTPPPRFYSYSSSLQPVPPAFGGVKDSLR